MTNPEVQQVFGDQASALNSRIWQHDHTVWSDDPTEITNRLGWLTIAREMVDAIPEIEQFATNVVNSGIQHVVLLGMGGSSLGPEVIRRAFGSAPGYPELIVLDSTIPGTILCAQNQIDPAKTLFLVSSKSGGTIEPLSLYRHFRKLVENAVGDSRAGSHFAAVTDSGTGLQKLGEEAGFAAIFNANPNIGGRYSVLSHFGLVPAALIGVDLSRLLAGAIETQNKLAESADPSKSEAWSLAARIVSAIRNGRDKLTIPDGSTVPGFGLWAEQLVAESTGKQGRGVIPIAGEPFLDTNAYGPDRLFEAPDSPEHSLNDLSGAGHPSHALNLNDPYQLGALFLQWEYATAVAGAELGINPFDQPNVQAAKDATDEVLADFERTGSLPDLSSVNSLDELLSQAREGDYFAIMSFAEESEELTQELNNLRERIMQKHRIATTLGYGPRFLHSTGQLHKGGPNTVLAFQITQSHPVDINVPDAPYTFGTLADAQAIGDFQALQATRRRAARLHVEQNVTGAIRELTQTI